MSANQLIIRVIVPKILCVAFFLSFLGTGIAQKKNASFRINISKINSPISIDGVADDKAW